MPLPTPDFIDCDERRLVALSRDFTMQTRSKIPQLWHQLWEQQWSFAGNVEPAQYGASYSVRPDGSFSYAVGMQVDPMPGDLPEGACTVTLSAGRYAVFRKQGPVQELPQTFDAIFSTWLPTSGETQREGAVFERYPHHEGNTPESMAYEIWVPINAA
ncbi:MAG: GyrI-like domain-containing protein [Pseudomonadota bacterium]